TLRTCRLLRKCSSGSNGRSDGCSRWTTLSPAHARPRPSSSAVGAHSLLLFKHASAACRECSNNSSSRIGHHQAGPTTLVGQWSVVVVVATAGARTATVPSRAINGRRFFLYR
ncbi:hypothetical protein FOZ62_018628, partial [Perkinsus olseni]